MVLKRPSSFGVISDDARLGRIDPFVIVGSIVNKYDEVYLSVLFVQYPDVYAIDASSDYVLYIKFPLSTSCYLCYQCSPLVFVFVLH